MIGLFIVATLAVWRATLLITEDEGPFSVFSWLRDHIDPMQKTWLGRGINCAWCVSWWAGAAAAAWLWTFNWIDGSLTPLWWFGLSGGSIVLTYVATWMTTRRH